MVQDGQLNSSAGIWKLIYFLYYIDINGICTCLCMYVCIYVTFLIDDRSIFVLCSIKLLTYLLTYLFLKKVISKYFFIHENFCDLTVIISSWVLQFVVSHLT